MTHAVNGKGADRGRAAQISPSPDTGRSSSNASLNAAVHTVRVADLKPADSPRLSGLDEEHVQRLAEYEAALPPILVHRHSMRIIDGMHRLHAAHLRNHEEISVTFVDGTDDDLFLCAVEANVTHGLPLSLADRKAAARRVLASHPALSDRLVAAKTGLAARTVADLRKSSAAGSQRLNTRVGADGRLYPRDGSADRLRAAEIVMAQPDLSVREIARAAGISVGTAHDVRSRLLRGEPPVSSSYGSERKPKDKASRSRSSAHDHARPPAVSSVCHENGRDGVALLRSLTKDPSLRHTQSGRELLRWLHSQPITDQALQLHIKSVPPHCSEVVAEFARQAAAAWQRLAMELEDTAH